MGSNGECCSPLPAVQLQFPILFVLRIKAKCQFPFKMGAGFHYILCPLKNERHIIALSRKLRYEPCFKIRGCQCAAIVFDADRDLLQNRDESVTFSMQTFVVKLASGVAEICPSAFII